jgi:hypothetical protein
MRSTRLSLEAPYAGCASTAKWSARSDSIRIAFQKAYRCRRKGTPAMGRQDRLALVSEVPMAWLGEEQVDPVTTGGRICQWMIASAMEHGDVQCASTGREPLAAATRLRLPDEPCCGPPKGWMGRAREPGSRPSRARRQGGMETMQAVAWSLGEVAALALLA